MFSSKWIFDILLFPVGIPRNGWKGIAKLYTKKRTRLRIPSRSGIAPYQTPGVGKVKRISFLQMQTLLRWEIFYFAVHATIGRPGICREGSASHLPGALRSKRTERTHCFSYGLKLYPHCSQCCVNVSAPIPRGFYLVFFRVGLMLLRRWLIPNRPSARGLAVGLCPRIEPSFICINSTAAVQFMMLPVCVCIWVG